MIYAGELGSHSSKMIRYFEVPSIFPFTVSTYVLNLHFLNFQKKILFLFIISFYYFLP